jgi:hypothetical protein
MFTDISTEKPQFSMFRSFFINLADLTAAQRSRFVCAAGDCHVPEHWSLATCQECEDSNFYNDAAMNCTYHYGNLIDGGHSLKKFKAQAKRYSGANYSESWASCTVPRGAARADLFNIFVRRTQFPRKSSPRYKVNF